MSQTNAENKKSLVFKIVFVLLFLITTTLLVIATNPRWRAQIKKTWANDNRKILAKVEGLLKSDGPRIQVFKIKSADQLLIEIYTAEENPLEFKLKQSEFLTEKTDGYFSFQGNATNLALGDIDQDGLTEILVPTFDDQGIARLNTFHFDEATQNFQKTTSDSGL